MRDIIGTPSTGTTFLHQTIDLDSISDDIWFQQISDGLSLIDELQCTHSRDGYYLIEVLLMAVSKKGMELKIN